MFAYFELIIECSPLLVTNVKTNFASMYRCCSSMYDIFIKYIVFYYEIKLKYCQDMDVCILINQQYTSARKNNVAEKTLDEM